MNPGRDHGAEKSDLFSWVNEPNEEEFLWRAADTQTLWD